MDRKEALSYYSRKDIQEAILKCCKDREVGTMFDKAFGKRPDTIEFLGDIARLARQGATSFHISEERWEDPLALMPGMTKKQLDENRKGWDLVIDIDTKFWEYSKWTAYFLIEALKYHDIKNISLKFSGNKGWHIAVPFEVFPEEVQGVKTKNLFPESLRVIAAYLENFIKDYLSAKILENDDIEDIAAKAGISVEDLTKLGKFDPFKIIEIDTVLISSRHMFRAPYSLHEKSGLVSLPIGVEELMGFDKESAKPDKVSPKYGFIEDAESSNEAKSLVIQAFDWYARKNRTLAPIEEEKKDKNFELPKIAIPEDCFPPCIRKILNGGMEDGRKRALFILIKFLKHMGWSWDDIEKRIKEWNETHPEQLRENYIVGQISYAKKSKQNALAPNCDNPSYYKDLGLCNDPLPLCSKIKNPVNFARIRAKTKNEAKQKKKKS